MDMAAYVVPEPLISSHRSLPYHVSLEARDSFSAVSESQDHTFQLASTSDTGVMEDHNVFEQPNTELNIPKRPGRRISRENTVLRKFIRSQETVFDQPPKLENIRYRSMRTIKKILRRLAVGKQLGSRGLLQFQYTRGQSAFWFRKFCEYAQQHPRPINVFAELQNGPKVDQTKCTGSSVFSTYNNPYMEYVFSTYEIRVIYRLFVNLIFSDDRPASLNQRFKIMCCRMHTHGTECELKWAEFRKMMEGYLGAKVLGAEGELIPELQESPSLF